MIHTSVYGTNSFVIPGVQTETYRNMYDRTIRVGKSNLLFWKDLCTAVTNSLKETLTLPLTGIKLGSSRSPGIIHDIGQRLNQSIGTINKIIRTEMGGQFVLVRQVTTNFIVRVW